MKIIDPGHKYQLHTLDGFVENSCLTFVKRQGAGYPGNVGSYSGTTCQEVLKALIDRVEYLQNQIPCWQTGLAKLCLIIALWCFEFRHAARKQRLLTVPPWRVMQQTFCDECGHIQCQEHKV